jgi:hypothetical protein
MFVSTPQDTTSPENDNNGANPPEEVQPAAPKQVESKTEGEVDRTRLFSPADQLPPEAQGETNGGPLGCCLGVMVGLLLSLSVAIISRFYADQLAQILGGSLSMVIRIAMALAAFVALVVCGKLGWKIGKRLYREYDTP